MKKSLKGAQKSTAKKRIEVLFEQAQTRPAYASRYVAMARKLAQRFKVQIPAQFKRRFCKECNAFWVPGKTVQVRVREQRMIFTCLKCGAISRLPRVKT